ncbi:hypothetical protein VNO80_16842 [Phaseolus coccineus]|uniref:Gnk2-homologous domain-containing protein n=1 Tax=Phaseolus coccineus TaxID=3886 RepID=A0AAN9MSF2_PHACN
MAAISCILSFVLSSLISQVSAQFNTQYCDNNRGNYTINSTYHNNLNTLLSTLSSHTQINYGFYNFSYGQNSDKVNAIGLCRGDVKPDECRSCLNDSALTITQLCPNQKEALLWLNTNKCLLRYSHRTIFGVMESSPGFYLSNTNNVTEADKFNQALSNLMRNLTVVAASGDSRLKYAEDSAIATNFKTVYGLVQCTPDLYETDCNRCLDGAILEIPSCCGNKMGGRVLRPSCNIRFESAIFYDQTPKLDPDVTPPSPSPPSSYTNTSPKDIFSFGVLLLEIVSGQKNSGIRHGKNVENLLSFTWRNWRDGTAINIVDPSLENYSRNEVMICIHIGLLYVQENLTDRPTMATIMLMLSSYSLGLPIPSEPAFYVNSTARSLLATLAWGHSSRATANQSTNKSAQESENENSITEPYPR